MITDLQADIGTPGDYNRRHGYPPRLSRQRSPYHIIYGVWRIAFQDVSRRLGSVVNGWKKHIAIGASNAQPWVMMMIMIWIGAGITLPIYIIATWFSSFGMIGLPLVLYLIYAIQFKWMCQRLIRLPWLLALFYPLYILFFFHVYGASFVRVHLFKKVEWKGREIDLKKMDDIFQIIGKTQKISLLRLSYYS
ncbi:hypothetical protein ACFOU0_13840 [Salinicoccus sesuvii]|uniref:Glycosyltransferase 2-like domain-containing protein n=1 Tax=Salinicoccus sesuvii TaxID=868281 RepID=A0ABV7N934_9STAP